MRKNWKIPLSALFCATWLLGGCSSQQVPLEDVEGDAQKWWDNPGLIQDYLAAVGMSPLLNARAEGPARTYAETDGRANMAAVLKAEINQLVENWSKDVGDLNREASFSSYINNEAITRQFVEATVAGAAPYKYKKTENNIYVLMVLRNPSEWVGNLADTFRDQALQDETYFKTELMKNDFRDRMDAIKNKETEKMSEQKKKFEEAVAD